MSPFLVPVIGYTQDGFILETPDPELYYLQARYNITTDVFSNQPGYYTFHFFETGEYMAFFLAVDKKGVPLFLVYATVPQQGYMPRGVSFPGNPGPQHARTYF